ncbi:bile acid:sodium symporter family protein [Bacillus testis]|uniref:bile acid:sodium symporter family protein n=1 Tax=Bacillus testis TaxID=1622072 RepID=UPI00067EF37E|nr:bile acid:sodium symporter [Bacillus testis]
MRTLADFFSKYLSSLIPVVAVLTYFSPYVWETGTWVPSLFLGFVIFFTGLSMDTSAIKEIRHKKKEWLITVLAKWTIPVLTGIILALVFFKSYPAIAAGVILTGAVPSATAATLYTFLAGGNISLVIASSLLDVGISPMIAPLAMKAIGAGAISISFISLLRSFAIIVIIPLSAGIALQRLFPQLPHRTVYLTKFLSPLSLLVVIHTLTASVQSYFAEEMRLFPLLIFCCVLQTVIPMAASYWIAKKACMHEADARAALFQVSLPNSALAGILAFEFFGGAGAVAPILSLIINLSIGAQVSSYFSTRMPIKYKQAA